MSQRMLEFISAAAIEQTTGIDGIMRPKVEDMVDTFNEILEQTAISWRYRISGQDLNVVRKNGIQINVAKFATNAQETPVRFTLTSYKDLSPYERQKGKGKILISISQPGEADDFLRRLNSFLMGSLLRVEIDPFLRAIKKLKEAASAENNSDAEPALTNNS